MRASRTAYLAASGVAGALALKEKVDSESAESLPSDINDVHSIGHPTKAFLHVDLPDKLPIYPKSNAPLVLLDIPSPLELKIGQIRREVCGYYVGARANVQGIVDRWIHVESMVETRLKSFRDPTEPLNPGLLYTGVAALTTSIFTRSRSLPTRFLLPPLSLLGAFAYFLPRTAYRVGSYAEELESRYAPRVGEIRQTGVIHMQMVVGRLGESAREGKVVVGKGVRSLVEAIESVTGLKLGDVLRKEGERENGKKKA
ncbi:apolipo protein O-domain-containing protein [Pisolithus croceorrhizus]|nr:apolipo protein O-domain-containing protein [Pisolithus croceorrhizus]KAI6133769.1 apolipo protein O-domain-containing protein [Pisolithus croceorrhizus]